MIPSFTAKSRNEKDGGNFDEYEYEYKRPYGEIQPHMQIDVRQCS